MPGSLFLILIGAILVLRGLWVIKAGKAKNVGSSLELSGPSARFMGASYAGLGLVLLIVAALSAATLVPVAFIAAFLLVRWGIPAWAENIYAGQPGVAPRATETSRKPRNKKKSG